MQHTSDLTHIIAALRRGDVIAYPTEGVYGLGCDPLNEAAVTKLLALKHRSPTRGLILVADRWDAVAQWTTPIDETHLVKALTTWPGPITWVFPAAPLAPAWITGNFDSVALRVSKHPTIKAICEAFGGPIVSTSANTEGEPPARDPEAVLRYFNKDITLLVTGELGGESKPTPIRDVLTDQEIRA
ncbi:MAG: L-threonylcarbamoyladenylate synthase [Pseudomonadota bacterium]|nr:L-threonylcarbamoyladenylate synthase [Pseudomonadota bacterium]